MNLNTSYLLVRKEISVHEWLKIYAKNYRKSTLGELFSDQKIMNQINSNLKGSKIYFSYRNGSAKVIGINLKQTVDSNISGKNQTIRQYMKETYNIDVKDPKVPLLEVKQGKNTAYYIPELCT